MLKCVTQSDIKPDPIAPKSNAAFYGAAKIDKLFENQTDSLKRYFTLLSDDMNLFDQSGRYVPLQGLVIFVQFRVTVAWQVHAQAGKSVYVERKQELRRVSFVEDTIIQGVVESFHLVSGSSGSLNDAFKVVEPMVASCVETLYAVPVQCVEFLTMVGKNFTADLRERFKPVAVHK